MEKTRAGNLGIRSELQQQLQILGDVILKPFLVEKDASETKEKYFDTKYKLAGYVMYGYELWEDLLKIFHDKVYEVIYEQYIHYHDKAVAEGNNVATLAKTPFAYHRKLHSLALDCLTGLEALTEDEFDSEYDLPSHDRFVLAQRFLYFILFLYAVPQPFIGYDRTNEKGNIKEEPNEKEPDKDVAWMLGPCKIYQDNTEFMVMVRDLSIVIIYIDETHLHVPMCVLHWCKYYAKLGRDDSKARVFERNILNHIKRDGNSTLTPDHVKEIIDHAKYKPKQEIKAIAKYDLKQADMRFLLRRLRSCMST